MVPGRPAKKTIISMIAIPRLGVKCKIPTTSTIDLVLYRRYIQSTIKNINADKKA
jgi:hypothetical protein